MKNAANIHFYDNGENCEILFETGSYNEGEAELFSASPGKNPVQIATMVSSVLYDSYSPGGNLYYFVKKSRLPAGAILLTMIWRRMTSS